VARSNAPLRHHGSTEALPAGSTGGQATQQRDGNGALGQDRVVDLSLGFGGAEARAIAAPAQQNPATCARTTTQAAQPRRIGVLASRLVLRAGVGCSSACSRDAVDRQRHPRHGETS